MRASTATTLLALLAAAILGAAAPAAQAGFGVERKNWEAGTCNVEGCTYASPHEQFFTHSAGHPPFGLTTFELNHKKGLLGEEPEGAPLKRVRVDVPPGLAANPQALSKCTKAAFEEDKCSEEAGHNARVGTNVLTVLVSALKTDLTVEAPVYNLEPEPGLPLEFGIHVEALGGVVNEHVLLKGHVAWASDYHEYFEIANIEQENPVLKSKLIFFGQASSASPKEGGNFITLPTECTSTTTSYLEVESGSGEVAHQTTETPVGVEHCSEDPFSPAALLSAETAQSDTPDGVSTEVQVPQLVSSTNSADIRSARVTLPEGLTLNPAAANGLQTCSPAQIGIGSEAPVGCPEASRVGSVAIETDLPPHSLSGGVYLGDPGGGPLTGPPFEIYIDAESARYGVSVRLRGHVNANPLTGRLEASFSENPQLPFSDLVLTLNGGPRAPLANPLACGSGQAEALFTAYTSEVGPALSTSPFATSGCPSPLPFSWSQSGTPQPVLAGAFGNTSYTFSLSRSDGQQYLAKVATTLPAGVVGAIPAVLQCPEPQASSEAGCPAASQIGTATATAGAGSEPYSFSGPVYLTGPYGGGPFGLAIDIPAVAGPFNFGTVVARAAIGVDPHSGRVTAVGSVPTIRNGVPLRLRTITVTVNRPAFLYNPTSCAPLATESALSSTFGASAVVASAFQVGSCGSLPFAPVFGASTSAGATKAGGASLLVSLTQPSHQANIHSVVASLPVQLPSRLTTLQQACPEATYAANPFSCPAGSNVGSASVTTPVLPGVLSGPAYLVSHGGAAFPDLDILLEGSGVRVILSGSTDIKGGITTSTFASVPDVPVSSFSLSLPMGPHSALAAYGDLCARPLVMPTTITAQSGAQVKQNTILSVAGCAHAAARSSCLRVLRRKVSHGALALRVRVCAAGRLSARGRYLRTASRKLRRAGTVTLKVALSRSGRGALGRHRLKVRVRLALVPSRRGQARASASTLVTFRR